MQEKRSRKEQRRDRQQHYEELESRHDAKALERFKRPAYQSVSVALTSKEAYDGDARTGIANSGFYQNFEEWTEQNNLNDIVPELDGHDAVKVEVLQSGYLFSTEADLGRYQMICRLIYK